MKLDRFVQERRAAWDELEELIRSAKSRPERLGATRLRRLGSLYRSAAADLAVARRRWPGDPVTEQVESLVARSRPLVYDVERRRGALIRFITTGYWQRVREMPAMLLISTLLLVVPGILGIVWGISDPPAAVGFVPAEARSVIEPRSEGTDLGLSVGEQTAFSAFIMTNNIRVAFLAFAAGISAGIGTAFVLVYNGSFIGTLTGLSFSAGNGEAFAELVLPHGLLELSLIVVAGAAGLRLGWAIIAPGDLRRGAAAASAARPAVEIAAGTALWLVLAGLIEGFITPRGIGIGGAVVVGGTAALCYWTLVFVRGRPSAGDEPAERGEAPALTS